MVGSPDAMPHIFEGAALRARRIRLYPSGGVLLHNPHDPSPDLLEHASTLRPFHGRPLRFRDFVLSNAGGVPPGHALMDCDAPIELKGHSVERAASDWQRSEETPDLRRPGLCTARFSSPRSTPAPIDSYSLS
jgi:hypothetical protein